MPEAQESKSNGKEPAEKSFQVTPPTISLPKGGGAIRGMGEKFAANPVTGTGSMSVPIATSPGRSGFGPQLSLSYDSGAGNGPFGFGWSLSLPSITRKTDKGLPQYLDAVDSDVFILSGAEDLVPVLIQNRDEQWVPESVLERTVEGQVYGIKRYRPRIEGLFARIERWSNQSDPTDVYWRSISKDNITTWYGKTGESRISDPADPTHIFSWLICESHDDKGNVLFYGYKSEDSSGVLQSHVHEANRTDSSRSANRYLKRIRYGNRVPYYPELSAESLWPEPPGAQLEDGSEHWLFEAVFDYDDHDPDAPTPAEANHWPVRQDPFSSYRAGFEVRTYRLCQRVLMFHHFPGEPNVEANCLVRSTDFTYSHEQDPTSARNPVYTFLREVTQAGYQRENGGYRQRNLPPVAFEYTEPIVQDLVEEVDAESLENLPIGLDGTAYQWTDLHGEGIPGILTEQGGAWFYKRNWSPIPDQLPDGSEVVKAKFAALETVAVTPNVALGGAQFMDLAGDGQPDLVTLDGPMPGLYEHDHAEGWEPFRPFTAWLNRNMQDPNLKFVDLDGDGHADVLITEDEALVWHPSLAEEGFGPAQRVAQAFDEEKGPRLVFNDGTQSIYLADLSGDGLTDLVRIRNGEVCYWPNLGYGKFGAKVTMDHAPWFDYQDQFDHKRIRLADIDGTGTTDIIYLHRDGVRLYFNQSGNSWSEATILDLFPQVDDVVSIVPTDLLGNGTACLVWSSPLAGDAQQPMRYVNLMGPHKPHLLVRAVNNLGAETHVTYAPSTKFYLLDKQAGAPWITKLPFPVHVVERVETYDRISGNRFVTRYSYHHGYFDGEEREFRGFGRVDQLDTEEFAALTADSTLPPASNIDQASHVPSVLTKTWFHTGVHIDREHISNVFAGLLDEQDTGEYYREPGLTDQEAKRLLLDDTVLPLGLTLEEEREACRSLKGAMLRQEVYALDGTEKEAHPYVVTEQNFTIRMLQPEGTNRYAVFFTHAREALTYQYERNPDDPRVGHALTLEVDEFGNVIKSAAVGYGRRRPDSTLSAEDQAKQAQILITYSENTFTNTIELDDAYRTPLPAEMRSYELTGLELPTDQNRFSLDDVREAGTNSISLPYEEEPSAGQQRRLIEHVRTLYRPNDLGLSQNNPVSLLALGRVESLALSGEAYKLALTPGLIEKTFNSKVTDQILQEEGRYAHSEGDHNWWIPSGRTFFSPNTNDDPATELAQAMEHFFVVRRVRDPFHRADFSTESVVEYDQHDLLVVHTRDALGNVSGARHDYRVLQPDLLTDPNGNRSEVAFDTLGMVVGTAIMGKETENKGDSLVGFNSDLDETTILDHLNDPLAQPHAILQGATTRLVYDLFAYSRTKDQPEPQPAVVYALARETHQADLAVGAQTKVQHSFSYSDGFGREIQKKIQAEPGPLVEGGPEVNPRWVGSGWAVFNNKGKPVRQYEPFFSKRQRPDGTLFSDHRFEFGITVGVSPVLFYDPLQRVVATLNPNHTWQKTVFDPWRQETWDVNDTLLLNPVDDLSVVDYFRRLDQDEYLPTWHSARINGALGVREQAAAQKTEAHANTPAVAHMDSLGRTFLTITHNRVARGGGPFTDEFYRTSLVYDIEGNQREVIDANDRAVMRYDYDLLGTPIHSISMDAGERWMLNDVAGQPMRAWDARGHEFRTEYDQLHRPVRQFVRGSDVAQSDPRVLNRDVLFGKVEYGEGQADDIALNLRTRAFRSYDNAGVVSSDAYDFKGNLLRGSRQLAADYKGVPDWSGAVALEPQVFSSSTTYDALNRPISLISPDSSEIQPTYNEANLLEKVQAQLRGAAEWTSFVEDIDYNAKGQRESIRYGNGVETTYDYDPKTFRLINLKTTRDSNGDLQNLSYTYDPTGNITHIRDDAQQTIYFRNRRVEPSNDYLYDATYQLIEATGREHLGQNGGVPNALTAPDAFNGFHTGLLHPGDGNAMGLYRESYVYDAVGNFLSMQHRGTDPSHPGWTRAYFYEAISLIEDGTDGASLKTNNRLSSTTVSANNPIVERYLHDAHGNMIRMPHLGGADFGRNMHWDYRDQLRQTDLGGGGTAYYVYDAAGQRTRKIWEKAPGLIEERMYLGGFEIFRRHDGAGAITLERETLHITDDKRRIALVENKTIDITSPLTPHTSLVRYQLNNHLGSACVELNEAGEIISYEEYFPYGSSSYQAVNAAIHAAAKRYRYTGKEKDEETGLTYHGMRYCAVWLGRWVSPDPAGLADGNNLYAYARNNPVLFYDPTGTTTLSDIPENIRPPDDTGTPLKIGFTLSVKLENGVFQGQYTGTGGSDAWLPADSPEKIQWWSDVAGREDAKKWMVGYLSLFVGVFAAAEFGGAAGIKWFGEEVFSEATGIPVSPRDLLDATYAIRAFDVSTVFHVMYAGKRDLLKAFSFADDFMRDEERAGEALKAFDAAVQEVVAKAPEVSLRDAAEGVLRTMETKHGFGGVLTLEERGLSPVEFAKKLTERLAINDPYFKIYPHSELGHRVQMWALGYELDRNPGAFGRATVAELQAAIGNAGVLLENNKIWVTIFDRAEPYTPSSPEWWGWSSDVLCRLWKIQ
ncbi:MAG: hypothetical protein OEY12_01355 [Nitrospira sp.]|nr:hypothetical protein [Nitrospira sp.]